MCRGFRMIPSGRSVLELSLFTLLRREHGDHSSAFGNSSRLPTTNSVIIPRKSMYYRLACGHEIYASACRNPHLDY